MQMALKHEKELRRRENILNGNLWKMTLNITLPILLYNLCNYLYGIYDMMIVQSANIGEAADIVVLDQIKNMISTLGGAIATGGGILISRKYGENDIKGAKRCANTLFSISLVVAGLLLLFIPIGEPFLRLLKTDESTISNAMGYYNVQIIILFITTLNSVLIVIEKSKGNTLPILLMNFGVIALKIFFTSLFAFGPFENVTITYLAIATLIAQSFLFVCCLITCFRPSNILGLRLKELNFDRNNCKNIISFAIPGFINSFLFSYGKVYINTVATSVYGKMCVGALGISNTIAGLLSNVISSFGDAGATIVSQNYGNKNGRRIKKFFMVNCCYVISVSLVGTIFLYIFKGSIANFFAPNDNLYQEMIITIFKWECLDILFMGLSNLATTIYRGFGKMKTVMALSMCTLFVYRIPILLFLIHIVKMDYEACGIAMFGSNFLAGVVSFTAVIIFLIKIPKRTKYNFLFN